MPAKYFILTLLLLLPACSTVDTRIKEHESYFASLPAQTQQRLREQRITVGDSKDMVYIAMGHPDMQQSRIDSTGVTGDVWSYLGVYYTKDSVWYYPHHRRRKSDHPFGDHYHGPETIDVQHEYEAIRIEFEKDKIKAIDQTRR